MLFMLFVFGAMLSILGTYGVLRLVERIVGRKLFEDGEGWDG